MELELRGVGYQQNDFKDLESHSFGIDTEDEDIIVSIVRDKIYSHPIQVLVQEYICNGRDSNVEQGSPYNHLDIFVPSQAIQTFKVRDYGTGLSHEQVVKVFIKLGKSTKRTRDDVIGAYGLGSKSGFAYTDSFLITSFYNGKKTQYLALVAENQKGDIKVLSHEDTDEPNGIEIEVNLKEEKDIRKFKKAIFRTTAFWKYKPNYTNILDHEVQDWIPRELFRNKDVVVTERNRDLLEDGSMILCDGVPYPFDQSPTFGTKLSSRMENNYLFLTTNAEVKPAANRENIIKGEDLERFTESIPSKIEAISLKYENEVTSCSSREELIEFFENLPFDASFEDYNLDCLPTEILVTGTSSFLFPEEYEASYHRRSWNDRWTHRPSRNSHEIVDNTLFILNDRKIQAKSIARKLKNSTQNNTHRFSSYIVFEKEPPESVKKFFDVKKYSEIKPKPVKREVDNSCLQFYTAQRSYERDSIWSCRTSSSADLAQSGRYYAILNAWDLKDDITYSQIETIDAFLRAEGQDQIALISYRQLETLKKFENFNLVHVSDFGIEPNDTYKAAIFHNEYAWLPSLDNLAGIERFHGYQELEKLEPMRHMEKVRVDIDFLKERLPNFYHQTVEEFSFLDKFEEDIFLRYYANLWDGGSWKKEEGEFETEDSERGKFIDLIKFMQENQIIYEDTQITQ